MTTKTVLQKIGNGFVVGMGILGTSLREMGDMAVKRDRARKIVQKMMRDIEHGDVDTIEFVNYWNEGWTFGEADHRENILSALKKVR